MYGRLLPLLLILHCLKDAAVVGYLHDESNHSAAIFSYDGGVKQLRKEQRSTEEWQLEQATERELLSPITKTRQRRHIGSVAAFRGLPEKVAPKWRNGNSDTVNQYDENGLALRNPDSINSDEEMIMLIDNSGSMNPVDEIGMEKRYPAVQTAVKSLQVPGPLSSVVRMMAIEQLQRLMTEAGANTKMKSSHKSKKHLGALARNNAVPHKTRTPSAPNKGIGLNPPPTKKTLLGAEYYREALRNRKNKDYDKLLTYLQNDSLDMYADYADNTSEEESLVPGKRHIGSVFKSGWYQPYTPSNSSKSVPPSPSE